MRKGHRSFHHVFWYIALPALILWLFLISPEEERNPERDAPPGGNISIVDPVK